jgi:hypothetical protein
MLNFSRDPTKAQDKSAIKPASYPYAPVASSSGATGNPAAKAPVPAPATVHQGMSPEVPVLSNALPESATRAIGPDTPGSQLFIGPNIKLKGVEISDCDVQRIDAAPALPGTADAAAPLVRAQLSPQPPG